MIYIIRANHTNEFELQNYIGVSKYLDLSVISSLHPLSKITLPLTRLLSPTDLPSFPFRHQILNRLIGGEQWLISLKNIVKKEDILHTAETYTPYTHQAVQLRKKGFIKKLICTCWETIPHNNEKFARLRQWKKDAYKYVDIFHTPTDRAKQALVKEGVDRSKIVVIPYGVDTSRFKPSSLPGVSRKVLRPRILTVARLELEKGIKTIESVASMLPKYNFIVVGSGKYKPQGANIKIKAVEYGQIHKIYQSADLFFLPSITTPSWEEQYGMAVVEAMACGVPIITSNSGALPEIVGDAGILISAKNVDKMVKSIKDIIENPDEIIKYSQLALDRSRKLYEAKIVSQKLRELY